MYSIHGIIVPIQYFKYSIESYYTLEYTIIFICTYKLQVDDAAIALTP